MNEARSYVCLDLPLSAARPTKRLFRLVLEPGRSADSEEKHEPVSDIDTAVVASLKALDPDRPIREADICSAAARVRFTPNTDRERGFPAKGHVCTRLGSAR